MSYVNKQDVKNMSEQNKQKSKADYRKTLYFPTKNYYTYMYYAPK